MRINDLASSATLPAESTHWFHESLAFQIEIDVQALEEWNFKLGYLRASGSLQKKPVTPDSQPSVKADRA